jgi:hypothetical protein
MKSDAKLSLPWNSRSIPGRPYEAVQIAIGKVFGRPLAGTNEVITADGSASKAITPTLQ